MRKLIIASTLAASLAACTTAQVAQVDTVTAEFIAAVQNGAAATCKIIPTVNTIESVAAAVTGGSSIAVAATVNTVLAAICAAAPPPASARFMALPTQAQAPSAPALIGTTSGGVPVVGWRAGAVHFGHRHK